MLEFVDEAADEPVAGTALVVGRAGPAIVGGVAGGGAVAGVRGSSADIV